MFFTLYVLICTIVFFIPICYLAYQIDEELYLGHMFFAFLCSLIPLANIWFLGWLIYEYSKSLKVPNIFNTPILKKRKP